MKKTKKEPRFKLARRGYDVRETESYIDREAASAEQIQSEQRARIVELTKQIDALTCELAAYKAREEQIKSAIVSATEKAEVMTADIRLRYGMELDRLNLFREKWTGAYSELKERYNFGKDALNVESVAVNAKLEIERFLSRDFSIAGTEPSSEPEKQFRSESERLSSTESGVEDLKRKLAEATAKKNAAFSLEEAQHPTESLAELCSYLGLGKKATV